MNTLLFYLRLLLGKTRYALDKRRVVTTKWRGSNSSGHPVPITAADEKSLEDYLRKDDWKRLQDKYPKQKE